MSTVLFGTREITTNWQNYVEQYSKRFQILKSSKVGAKVLSLFRLIWLLAS